MDKTKIELLFIFMAFFGPLPITLIPSTKNMSKVEKEITVEGLWLFSIYILFTLILLILSGIPFIGLAFSIFNRILLFLYLVAIVSIMFKKSANEEFEIPFATFYAKRIIKMGII